MRNFLSINLLLMFCYAGITQERVSPHQRYYFEGDEVVFEFDTRHYNSLKNTEDGKQLDFADLEIYDVAISGNFNNWSRKQWKMEKTGPTTYQLRKKIDDFDDPFQWDFKFIINESYWAVQKGRKYKSEDKNYLNGLKQYLKEVTQNNNFWKDAFGEDLYPVVPDPDGNASFFLRGYEEAQQVILTGSFNAWDERQLKMEKAASGWQLTIHLAPGTYEYKFIVDSEWIADPANPNTQTNQYQTLNSVLDIKKEVTFWLEGYKDAKAVYLAGDFNDWNPQDIRMQQEGESWIVRLKMNGGKHLYKFIVDGEWMNDPANPLKEYDSKGHVNNVIVVN